MVSASLRRRASVAALALFCAGFLSTCDFLTADIFPSWFSYVEARVDVRSIMKANGLGELAEVVTVEYTPYVDGSVDYSAVLVFAAGNGTRRLLVLNADNLAYRDALNHTNINESVGAAAGNFRCGDALVSPIDLNIVPAPTAWTNPDTQIFRTAVGGVNYVVRPNSSSQALFEEYTMAWIAGPSVTRNYDTPNNFYNFQDADYVNGWSVLATRQYTSYGFATSFATAGDFYAGGTVFDNVTALQTGPFRSDENGAWLTSGGPVAINRGDRRTDRLVRYKWGTGGFTTFFGDFSSGNFWTSEELDSIPFDDDEELRVLSFEPSGRWWFAYDRRTGYLYKLRTWWK